MDFSVLLCVYFYDNDVFFSEACDSILSQTLLPSEIILVVDGPVPKKLKITIDVFEKNARDKKVEFKIIWLPINMGHGIARQTGLELCSYDLVALVDADDINYKNRFEIQINYLQSNPQVSILGSQIREVDHLSKRPICLKQVPCESLTLSRYLKTRCPFNQMSVILKKKDVLDSGGYIDFFHNEDYFLWIRMEINGYIFANLPDILVDARVNASFYNRRGGLKYFLSEAKLQRYMLKNGVISPGLYLFNVSIRFVIQVLIPPRIRGLIFQSHFRNKL